MPHAEPGGAQGPRCRPQGRGAWWGARGAAHGKGARSPRRRREPTDREGEEDGATLLPDSGASAAARPPAPGAGPARFCGRGGEGRAARTAGSCSPARCTGPAPR